MRNEAPYALEWIAHHRAIGVTDFLIYTNDCEDGTPALLSLLPGVTVVEQERGEKPPQWRALKAAWEHPVVQNADWLACLDCDEFINLGNGLSGILDLIDRIEASAIVLRWRLFGSGGELAFSDQPVTERFTKAAPEDLLYPAISTYFKTLFRRDGPFRQFGVHRPKQKNSDRHGYPVWVDGSGRPASDGLAQNDGQIMDWGRPIQRDLVQLNHYSIRSAAEFMVKRHRGLPNHQSKQVDLTYWVERNFNAVEDTSIAEMRPGTEAVLADFVKIDGVSGLYVAACDWHKARFQAMMTEENEQKLYGRLCLAGSSDVLDREASMRLINMYRAAHAKGQ